MASPRTIIRRVTVEVEFHQVDMMQVVHNSEYFRWFEKGRFQVLEELFPLEWAVANRVATPVVTNHCEYLKPAVYGDTLVVTTRHRLLERWDGRFQFDHSISNTRNKAEICSGQSAVTVVDMNTGTLVKEIPADVWQRYQNLK